MSAALDDLLKQALALPDDSKLFLAEELMASVEAANPIDEEILRRRAEHLAGTAIMIPVEEALRQAREVLTAQKTA